jgi:hypothetical protein
MKKLLSLLLSMCVATGVFALTPQRGYRGFVEWSNDITSYKYFEDSRLNFYYTGVSTSHGYQFNPNLFVGAGLAIQTYTGGGIWKVPVFAQVRTDQQWGKFTPFGDLRVGYDLGDCDGSSGYYFSPTVGYCFNWGRKVGLNVALGLTLKGYSIDMYNIELVEVDGYYTYNMDYIGVKHGTKPYFTFRVGLDF